MSPTPFRGQDASPANNFGKAVRVEGKIISREDVYVDGQVEGAIELIEAKVTVGPNGRVKATISAREVVIIGAVQGDVTATDKVDIRKDAQLEGNITTARISIEDGAVFKGSIDIRKPDPKPAVSHPAPVQPAQPFTPGAPAAVPGVTPATPPLLKR
jgi:cytoskeletal protein CcmA (bactofilin family)